MTQPFNSTGPDNNLDVVISLLAFGSTPMSAATRRRGKFLTLRGTMPSTSHLSAALSAPRTSSIYHLFCVCVWRKSSLQAWLWCLCSYSRCHDGNTLMCAVSSWNQLCATIGFTLPGKHPEDIFVNNPCISKVSCCKDSLLRSVSFLSMCSGFCLNWKHDTRQFPWKSTLIGTWIRDTTYFAPPLKREGERLIFKSQKYGWRRELLRICHLALAVCILCPWPNTIWMSFVLFCFVF